MKAKAFKTPFCTFNSVTLYSFSSAGTTVKGPQASAIIAIATVVQILSCLSCIFKLSNKGIKTS